MTFTNRKKAFSYKNKTGETITISGPVPYNPSRHELWSADFHLYRDGIAVARLRGNLNHAEWVIPNPITLPNMPVEKVEPIEVAVALKLHVNTWMETKTMLQRIIRRRLRYIARCIRKERKIEKEV